MSILATKIKAFRTAHKLTAKDLGIILRVSPPTILSIEREESLPSIPMLKTFATFFKLSPTDVGEFVLKTNGTSPGPQLTKNCKPTVKKRNHISFVKKFIKARAA